MKVKDLIKTIGPQLLNMEAVDVVVIAVTEVAPSVGGACSPDAAKKLLEIVLAGDWPVERSVN